MRASRLCAMLIAAVAVAGCEHDHYVVEVTPEGDGFQRKLTCWHVSGEGGKDVRPLAKEKLAAIAKLYHKSETIEGGKKHVFTGRFTDKTPADVGGAGSYTHFASPLGSTSCYIERFRGNDDLEAELATRRAAADKLTDLAIGWFEAELGQEPGFDRLKEFLDNDLRRDLKNLGIYTWAGAAMDEHRPDTEGEFYFRLGHYLCERDYLSPKDVPKLVRAMFAEDSAPLLRHLRRLVADKMGIAAGEPLPKALAILADEKRLVTSWDKYLQTTDLYKQRLREWQAKIRIDPEAGKPTPGDVVNDLVEDLFFRFRLFEQDDVVELRLRCPEAPFLTNGKWDEEAGAVTWSKPLAKDASPPAFFFAAWSRADRACQEAHFGKVLLDGEDLAEYVVWYRGLNPQEAEEWDRLIADCKPDGDLKETIEAFRFSSDPRPDPSKPDQKPVSLADTPRGLILDALKAQGRRAPQPETK